MHASFRLALFASLITLLVACSPAPRELVLSGPAMGTTYSVKIVGTPATLDVEAVRRELAAVLATIDAQMSTYRADSAISRFNAMQSTEWIEVPSALAHLVSRRGTSVSAAAVRSISRRLR